MSCSKNEPEFHAYYREPGPLPRKACDHALFPLSDKSARETGCQFAKIDKYLFGLTRTGLDMFKCFFDAPEQLVSKYGWDKNLIGEIIEGAGWTGERLTYLEAMERMKNFADIIKNYQDGGILFLFSRKKVDFNVEVYSTPEINFIEGFLIASIDSENYTDYFSVLINEENIIEIECDYGLNAYPDDNPWKVIYDGYKLAFCGHEILPE